MTDYATARRNMIECQLRPNGVTDARVLRAIAETPRELFVPASRRSVAYVDEDVEIGHGRCLIEPMAFARMVAHAAVQPGDIVLDIGCGSGYSTAVLSRLANTVVAVEEVAGLAAEANDTMTELAIGNAVVVTGPLAAGWAGEAPYDAILIGGAVEEIPQPIVDQLGEGGRLMAVVRPGPGPGRMTLLLKSAGSISRTELHDASIPLLDAFRRAPGFVF
jgi:protein-L-isoaspartate(D-aspartate) O-methyltransferase